MSFLSGLHFKRNFFGADLAAGAATWAVLVPLGLSIAAIAGVEPVVGLYALPLALVGYAIFGGQRVLVMGPDAAVAILSGSIVASIAVGKEEYLALTITLALLVGVVYLLFYFLNARILADSMRKAALVNQDIRVVVLDATASSGIDTSAADKIATVRDELADRGVECWVVNPRREGWKTVEAFLTAKQAAIPRVFDTLQDAIVFFETPSKSQRSP